MTVSSKDLSKYDFIVLVDKSGSMNEQDVNGQSRYSAAQEATENVARVMAQYDSDGIDVGFFNQSIQWYEGVGPEKVRQLFAENRPDGGTDTAQAVQKGFDKHFRTGKPTIIAVITDGTPSNKDALRTAIVNAANKIKSDGDLAVTFLQVGNDSGAAEYLRQLDDDLQSRYKANFDIVDTKRLDQIGDLLSSEEALVAAVND